MHATHCLIGCVIGSVLCLASIDAAANGLDVPGMGGSSPTAIGTDAPHDGTLHTGGDDNGADARDSRAAGSDTGSPSAAGSTDGGAAAPAPGPRRGHTHHVGWQSLLPGSIQ